MSYDPGIICFQHCQKSAKVYSTVFPALCYFCNGDLDNTELKIPPFRIPYPFKQAGQEPNAIVIKPTKGDFLNNYINSSNLHIGVTDSQGNVIEFDENGVSKSNGNAWLQCLPIKVIEHLSQPLKCYWDEVLYKLFGESQWSAERYDPEINNCYTFTLAFLRSLLLQQLQPYLVDKTVFCQHFISPKAKMAGKYISLFRKLKSKDMVVLQEEIL